MKSSHLKLVEHTVLRPVAPKGRRSNSADRVREHLTERKWPSFWLSLKATGMAAGTG